jgi:hypothetical protein
MNQDDDQTNDSGTRILPVDFLGVTTTVVGVVLIGWMALYGENAWDSTAGIIQLLIGAAVFGMAVYYLLGLLILEGIDYGGKAPKLASQFMLVVIPIAVGVSAVLTVIRT